MKYGPLLPPKDIVESHPARGAWIEIFLSFLRFSANTSHPARGAWIEMTGRGACPLLGQSHPARGAWIEMT